MTTTHQTHHDHDQRPSGTHAHKAESHGTKTEIPTLDINKLLEQFRIPGIDLSALAESQRKNLEALQEANRKAYAGAVALVHRQAEIFDETMSEWQAAAKQLAGLSPSESVTKQAELAQKAIESALGHMRELAEIAAKSQAEAYNVIGKRVKTGIEEFQDYFNNKKS